MKKVLTATVMHVVWEMDNEAWLIENADGSRELRTTSHGGEYEMRLSELDEKIEETRNSLDSLIALRNAYKPASG